MSDITDFWRFDGVPIDSHNGPEEARTPGESYTVPLVLSAESDSDDGSWPGWLERYRELAQYRSHAGAYATGLDGQYRPWYREQHANSLSLLVALRPPEGSTGEGGWFLVESMARGEDSPDGFRRLNTSLLFLAPLSKYDTARAARAMEANGT